VAVRRTPFSERAAVRVELDRCTACGLCARVCKGGAISMEGDKVRVDQTRLFGCLGCGQCVAVCPSGAIVVEGRDLGPRDVIDVPPAEARAGYGPLHSLMLARRSVRDFTERDVEPETVEKLLDSASTAPMGVPPSDVRVLVVSGREKVRELRRDLLGAVRGMRPLFSPPLAYLLRPFIGKEAYEVLTAFVGPAVNAFIEKDGEGVDWLLYDAPLALYFYGGPYADDADPVIAATYAMLAGESLGLGSCMLGFPGPVLKRSKRLRTKYGLPGTFRQGIVVVFGYPAVRYQHALRRRFAEVRRS
jgi:ferredoxin